MENTKIKNVEPTITEVSAPRKPLAVMRSELLINLNQCMQLAQNEGMPLDAIGYVVRDFSNDLNVIIQQEEQKQIQAYNQALKEYQDSQVGETVDKDKTNNTDE